MNDEFTTYEPTSPTPSPNYEQSPFFFGTPQTTDSQSNTKKAPKSNFEENSEFSYLLIKNLPPQIDIETIKNLYPDARESDEIIILPNTTNVYIKFQNVQKIKQLVQLYIDSPVEFNGKLLKVCLVSKIPLDLNEKSKILLVTIYNEKIEINVNTLYDIFSNFGRLYKMIIFKKKNYQAFIEFETPENASNFKQSLHNINYKGLFFLKIQFTQKSSLIVQANNLYECDFSRGVRRTPYSMSGTQFGMLSSVQNTVSINANIITNNNIINSNNIITSLGKFTFTDFAKNQKASSRFDNKSGECSPFSNVGQVAESKILQNSEQNFDYIFPITAKNLSEEGKHKMLFNMFSLYGNIDRITIDSLSSWAKIYFVSEFDQITAYHHINGINFFGKTLELELSRQELTTPKTSENFADDMSNTLYYRKNKLSPFTDFQNKQKTINKPCRSLYVFNLTRNVTLQIVRGLFEKFEKVEEIYYLNESKNSALCMFSSIQAAVKILCLFKNTNLVDKSLKINFANETLVKDNERERERRNQVSNCTSNPQIGQMSLSEGIVYQEPQKFQEPESCLILENQQKPSKGLLKGFLPHSNITKKTQFNLFGYNPMLDDF
jgi:hypothetical protein